MSRSLFTCLAILAVSFVSPVSAIADFPVVGHVYDTVDAVESAPNLITITGIIAGQSTPSTSTYTINVSLSPGDEPSRCDRFALLAMSKPGKFQFAMVVTSPLPLFSCKLITRAP
jgi:hypothetical protein